MSEPIKVGDLVRVVDGCCSGFVAEARDVIFVVERLRNLRSRCSYCHQVLVSCETGEGGDSWSIPVQWLKRIPPLDELERNKIVEELTA